jgi:FAD/FMN-containing dehydrogenase
MAASTLPIIWRQLADKSTYEKERVGRVFNAIKPDRYPRAIVKATHPSHVQEAVQLANKLQCRVSVRSGGHSWAAWSVRDDAILIDLGGWKEIELEEDKQIVKVSPSTTGLMLNESLGPKGLMFGGGHCPDVGLGGFLLQGGMGWNCKVLTVYTISIH